MRFRYDINALRAIAVISVIFYHFKISLFSGGYLGVDIFFVISGYLMSKIILEGFENSNFSLKGFYLKRTNRILPALLAMIVFTISMGVILLFPSELIFLSQCTLSSLFFLSNMFYWTKSGYFDQASNTNILLHTWSLSVEWQFYLLYPIFLLLLKKVYLKKRVLFNALIIGSVIGIYVIGLYITEFKFRFVNDSLVFYSFPTRSWELLVGCLVFLFENDFQRNIKIGHKNILCITGYIVIFLSVILFTEKDTWPNLYTGIPIIGTFLVLISNRDYYLPKTESVQFTGKISYSLYLWHWPLYVFANYLSFQNIKYTLIIILILTFYVSFISYKYIENNKKNTSLRTMCFVGALLICVSTVICFFPFNKYFINKNIIELSEYRKTHESEMTKQFDNNCFVSTESMFSNFSTGNCLQFSDSLKNVLLIGDSHAAEFSLSLRNKMPQLRMNLLQATTSSATYFLLNPKGRDENVRLVKFILYDFIPKNAKRIDEIIISSYWREAGLKKPILQRSILELISYIHKLNPQIKIKIIGQTEVYSLPYPSIAARSILWGKYLSLGDDFENRYILSESFEMNKFLKSFLDPDIYIDVFQIDSIKKNNRLMPYMFDTNHLTVLGTDQIINFAETKGLFR